MSKLCIISADSLFVKDLSEQIARAAPETAFVDAIAADFLLVDEEAAATSSALSLNKPVILFSSEEKTPDYADVVIKKPFSLLKFLQALENETLLPKVRRKECFNFKEYAFYPVKKEIFSSLSGRTTKLTEKEVDILKYLYNNIPATISKEELLENVWGYSAEATTHTVETHIYRLRQKVEEDGGNQLILTENNGYRLNV